MRALNLIGHKFGRLTVLERIKTEGYFSYRCSCECGNTTVVKRTGTLTSGNTQSCGCLQLNKMSFAEAHAHYSKNFRDNKLSNDQISQIRNKHSEGIRKCNLAREFNVSHSLITLIVKNKIYKQVA